MSTSDQQGNQPLTRKQLREIRLTGATPVISEAEAAAAAQQTAPATPQPKPVPPAHVAPAPQPVAEEGAEPVADVESRDAPLTRRRVRWQEQIRQASVPVTAPDGSEADAAEPVAAEPVVEVLADEDVVVEEAVVEEPVVEEPVVEEPVVEEPVAAEPVAADDDDDIDEEIVDVVPVSAARAEEAENEGSEDALPVAAETATTGERPVVSSTFGQELLSEQSEVPAFSPSFDDLITSDSGGSQNLAPNTLIFTPSAGEGSLSGPVASTGEILVTGSYDLPQGIGSQGHAHGTADGKEVDSVLIDGELPPSSSPTPIAASSAISTIKPAGEVIRPPAPEKGNKLMLILAITAGGLALVLAAALVIAFTTNVL